MKEIDRHKRINRTTGLVLILFLILFSVDSQADLRDIVLRFQPSIAIQEEYTSNVNLTQKDKKSDTITTIYPSIRFSNQPRSPVTGEFKPASMAEAETPGTYGIDLNYRLGLIYYSKYTDNNYIGHYGTLNGWYTFLPRLTFRLSEYLNRSEEPREPEYPGVSPVFISGTFVDLTDLNLQGTQRRRFVYLRNVVTPSLEYKLVRDGLVSLTYRNNIYRPEDPAAQKSEENYISPRITYWFDIRNGVSLEYGLTFGNFELSPDLTEQVARGRYTYRFNPRTSIFGEYAFDTVNFEKPGVDYYVQTPSLGIEYAFSPTLRGTVQFGWFWQSPREGSGQNSPFYNVVLSQRGQKVTYGLLFQGGYRQDLFNSSNQGFTLYHRAVGSVSYRIIEEITANLSGSYEKDKYGIGLSGPLLGVSQRENIWNVSGGLGYQMLRWLNLSLSLTYRADDSNVPNRDYNEVRGMIRAEATYK